MRDVKALILEELRSLFSELAFISTSYDSFLGFFARSGIRFGELSYSSVISMFSEISQLYALLADVCKDPPGTMLEFLEVMAQLVPLVDRARNLPEEISSVGGLSIDLNEETCAAFVDFLIINNIRRRRPILYSPLQ